MAAGVGLANNGPMLKSMALRREVSARAKSHPWTARYFAGRTSANDGLRALPALERFGDLYFDGIEAALEDMAAAAPELGLPNEDPHALLEALHAKTGALPHDENFEAFEEVVERFYSEPLYPMLEHAMFLHPVGLERLMQVKRLLPARAERVADVAVGPAAVLRMALESVEGWRTVHAFDVAEPCVRYARSGLARFEGPGRVIEVTRADARELPSGPDDFDLVIATEVIEHVPDPQRLVTELERVLAPGGRLIASVPLDLPWGPHLAHFRTLEEARGLFGPALQLVAENVVPIGSDARLCVFALDKALR